jgi:hypothetical protein
MNEPELVSPFRIAFREEGPFVNVYLAKQESMEGAMHIGSCMKSILNAEAPAQFLRLKEIFEIGIAAAIKDVLGVEVSKFETNRAPDHEKAGNA